MGTGTKRNGPCTCGSGRKYKKCHLPQIEGYLPTETGYVHKDSIPPTPALEKVLNDLKPAVEEARELVISKTFPYIVMPMDWWVNETKKFGIFNFTDEQITKSRSYKSGFIGKKFGVECFVTMYVELQELRAVREAEAKH